MKWVLVRKGYITATEDNMTFEVITMGMKRYLWVATKGKKIISYGERKTLVSARNRCEMTLNENVAKQTAT